MQIFNLKAEPTCIDFHNKINVAIYREIHTNIYMYMLLISPFPFILNSFTLNRIMVSFLIVRNCKRTDLGTEYFGQINTTKTGVACLPWTVVDRNISHNYCLNPESSDAAFPWCVAQDPNGLFMYAAYCSVPFCRKYCMIILTNLNISQ